MDQTKVTSMKKVLIAKTRLSFRMFQNVSVGIGMPRLQVGRTSLQMGAEGIIEGGEGSNKRLGACPALLCVWQKVARFGSSEVCCAQALDRYRSNDEADSAGSGVGGEYSGDGREYRRVFVGQEFRGGVESTLGFESRGCG